MSTQLAIRSDVVQSLDDVQRVAKLLAASGYFETKGNPEMAIAQLAVKVLAGREMGFQPFASAKNIHIIQGQPSISANLMAAAVKGSAKYDYRAKIDDTQAHVTIYQRNGDKWEELGSSTFTLEDGKRAGTQNLQKFPRNMLFARAMSNAVKWYCPDVFVMGVYTPEEMGATVDGDGEIIEAAPVVVHLPQPIDERDVLEVWQTWRKAADAIDWAAGHGIEMPDAVYTELKATIMPKNAAAMFEAFHIEVNRMLDEADEVADNAGVTVA
jgi:hypothetical protein